LHGLPCNGLPLLRAADRGRYYNRVSGVAVWPLLPLYIGALARDGRVRRRCPSRLEDHLGVEFVEYVDFTALLPVQTLEKHARRGKGGCGPFLTCARAALGLFRRAKSID